MISGIVLAAGTSSRFGATKQIFILGSKPLVVHAIDALRDAGVGELIVVVGTTATPSRPSLPPDVRIVRNPAYRDGQATSLAAGLHDVADDSEAAIVMQADQPGITRRRRPRTDRGLPRDARADRTPALPRRARTGAPLREIYAEAATCRATPAPGC